MLPERSPLIIVANDKITKDISIQKFGKEVLILQKKDLKEMHKAYLEYTKMHILEYTARIEVTYPIEGILCKIEFVKNDQDWFIISSDISEK